MKETSLMSIAVKMQNKIIFNKINLSVTKYDYYRNSKMAY